jgi:WD40 repeat protein
MLVVSTTLGGGLTDKHFVGVEVATGRIRWANPPADQKAGFYSVAGIQFEVNSPWFSAALEDGTVIRFNGLTGHEQRRFVAEWRTPEQQKARHSRVPYMQNASFSGDGRTLVSNQIARIYVWDVESGTLRRTIHYPHLCSCAFTLASDGRTLATTDGYSRELGDDLIRLYDIETGEQLLALEPGGDRGNVLTFSPDGTKLLTGFYRGTAIVWDVRRDGAIQK